MLEGRGDATPLHSNVQSSIIRLHICMVGPFGLRPKGTMAARALPLARALARRGHQVTLVLPPWNWPEDSGRVWEDEGVRILNIVLPQSPAPLFHLQTAQRLLEAVLAQQPDVVHCFKPKAYSGFVQAALWAMRVGLKPRARQTQPASAGSLEGTTSTATAGFSLLRLLSARLGAGRLGLKPQARQTQPAEASSLEGATSTASAGFSLLRRLSARLEPRAGRWRGRLILDEDDWEGWGGWNELEPYPWLAKHLFAWQEGWGLRHADTVTVASRALETLALAHGVPRERVVYLPNGGATDVPTGDRARGRARWGLPADAPVVLVYTRFFEYRVARLLAVLEAIHAARPATRFLVAGNGLYGEERELLAGWGRLSSLRSDRQTGKSAPQDRLVYAGWPGLAALPDIFAASDVALYPLDDTLVNRAKSPAKLLQLLAAGVPVVADAVGQATVYVGGPDGGGVLVRPETPTAMAEAAVALLDDPARRAVLAGQARAWVQQHYAWPRLAERLEAVYLGQTPADALP